MTARLKSASTMVAIMEQENVSRRQLADRAHCSPGFISHLTSGRRDSCTPELARRIAEALNVPPRVLFMPPVAATKRPTGSGKTPLPANETAARCVNTGRP